MQRNSITSLVVTILLLLSLVWNTPSYAGLRLSSKVAALKENIVNRIATRQGGLLHKFVAGAAGAAIFCSAYLCPPSAVNAHDSSELQRQFGEQVVVDHATSKMIITLDDATFSDELLYDKLTNYVIEAAVGRQDIKFFELRIDANQRQLANIFDGIQENGNREFTSVGDVGVMLLEGVPQPIIMVKKTHGEGLIAPGSPFATVVAIALGGVTFIGLLVFVLANADKIRAEASESPLSLSMPFALGGVPPIALLVGFGSYYLLILL